MVSLEIYNIVPLKSDLSVNGYLYWIPFRTGRKRDKQQKCKPPRIRTVIGELFVM